MNKIKLLLAYTCIAIGLSACASKKEPYDYSAYQQHKPKSILVVLPANDSLENKAPSAVLAHSTQPLSEAGYYVFPAALVQETFVQNGIYDGEQVKDISLPKLKQIFNPDAVLYLNVEKYGTKYQVIDSKSTVSVSGKLVDVATGQQLWSGTKTVAKSGVDHNKSNLIGALVGAVVTQIANTMMDQSYGLSEQAMNQLLATDCDGCILHGKYSPKNGQDKQLNK